MNINSTNGLYTQQFYQNHLNKSGEENGASSLSVRNQTQKAYGSSFNSTVGQAAIHRALDEIEPNSYGKITFSMISSHREDLEKTFSAKVEAGLLQAGVDKDAEFRLVATSDGKMEVYCDDPDTKKQIEDFFSKNSKLKDDFFYIQALGNMERAGQLTQGTGGANQVKGVQAGLQAQAMQAFFSAAFANSGNYNSMIGNFTESGAEYFMGANYRV